MKYLFACIFLLCSLFSTTVFSDNYTIRFGMMSFYPPFEAQNSLKQSYGFDVAVAQAICNQLSKRCIFVTMPFNQLFPSLDNNSVDAIISAIFITPERTAKYAMTIPYYKAEMSFLTIANQNFTTNPADLAGKTIGAIKGTLFVDYATKNYPNSKVYAYDTASTTLYNLSQGNVDLVLLDTPNARWWVLNGNNQFKLIGNPIPAGGYGIAVRKDNPALLNELNFALNKIKTNGILQQIINNYMLFNE